MNDVQKQADEGKRALKETQTLVNKALADIDLSKKQMDTILKKLGISAKDLDTEGDESKLSKYEKEIFNMAMKEYTAEIHATSGSKEAKGSNKSRPNIKLSKKGLKI